jgi:hypothetical protein
LVLEPREPSGPQAPSSCATHRPLSQRPRHPPPHHATPQIREVLEGYLDDDNDMHDMNLTAKELHAAQEAAEAAVRLRCRGRGGWGAGAGPRGALQPIKAHVCACEWSGGAGRVVFCKGLRCFLQACGRDF